jgi:hypothetical protein
MKRSREPEETASDYDGDAADSLESTVASQPITKVVELDPAQESSSQTPVMKCSLPPHKETLSFKSYEEYELHHNKIHTNRCVECRKNFPSEHLLNIHIEECHDSFVAVKRDRGEHTVSHSCRKLNSLSHSPNILFSFPVS